jgi:hypothetical protein
VRFVFFDYLKIKWDWRELGMGDDDLERVATWGTSGRVVQEVDTVSGEVFWTVPARVKKRSDSHTVTVTITGYSCTVEGSPARAVGGNNVFGSSDLLAGAVEFQRLAAEACMDGPGVLLPGHECGRVMRVDCTQNYALGSLAEVRQALAYLRQTEGGRYKIDARRGESIYWLFGSALRSAIGYAKGLHLLRQVMKREAVASEEEVELAQRLLRLELRLGRTWFKRRREAFKKSYLLDHPDVTPDELEARARLDQYGFDGSQEHDGFFGPLVGGCEVSEMNLRERVLSAAPTRGRGLSAFRTWSLIQAVGHQAAAESMSTATWYRHRAILFAAGLSWGDLSAGSVVPFRKRAITALPVDSWDDLRRAA